MTNGSIVSFDDELIILVDDNDNVLGYKTKIDCHQGEGILHRAFSIFILNDKNEVLLQKRSEQKQLWPGFWSNSCCSHPRKGETLETATQRRLMEELGISTDLKFLYRFKYHATFQNTGSERELCSVYIGKSNDSIKTNPNEIAEWKFITVPHLDKELAHNSKFYSPWLQMEWAEIRTNYSHMLT